jgi:hypothetical protein
MRRESFEDLHPGKPALSVPSETLKSKRNGVAAQAATPFAWSVPGYSEQCPGPVIPLLY